MGGLPSGVWFGEIIIYIIFFRFTSWMFRVCICFQMCSTSTGSHMKTSARQHVNTSTRQHVNMSACQNVSMSAHQHVSTSARNSTSTCQHVSISTRRAIVVRRMRQRGGGGRGWVGKATNSETKKNKTAVPNLRPKSGTNFWSQLIYFSFWGARK